MNKAKGFTLIEMLVVIAIVGLLASVVIVGLGDARKKARDARRLAEVNSIRNWAEANYDGAYPLAYSGSSVDPLSGNPYWYLVTGTGEVEVGACLETPEYSDGGVNCPGDAASGGTFITDGVSFTCDSGNIVCVSSAN